MDNTTYKIAELDKICRDLIYKNKLLSDKIVNLELNQKLFQQKYIDIKQLLKSNKLN